MIRLLRLWLREVFSHKAFIVGNIILLFTISIFTFAFVFSESMISGLESIIRTVAFGDIVISVPKENMLEVDSLLTTKGIEYSKYSGHIGILRTNGSNNPFFIKNVTADYFTKEKKKLANIETDFDNGLLIAKNKKYIDIIDGVLFLDDTKRGKIVDVQEGFQTGFSNFDNNVAFLITKDISGNTISYELKFKKDSMKDDLYFLIKDLDLQGINYNIQTKENLSNSFYSSLSSSRSSINLIALLFALLSAFYSISIVISYTKDNKKALSIFRIYGMTKKQNVILGTTTVLTVMVFFITLGFICGVFLSWCFLPFLRVIGNVFNINMSYYLLSFKLIIPFEKLLVFYALVFIISLIISLCMFITYKKSV